MLAKLHRISDINFFQTLIGHTFDSLKILKYYFEKNERIIEGFCKQSDIDKEIFMRNLFVAVYLHDIGKLTKEFQERILRGKRSPNYPHAFYGFPIVFEVFNRYLESFYPLKGKAVIEPLSVLAHHTQLYDGIYQDAEIKEVKILKERIVDFISRIEGIHRKLGFEKFFRLKLGKIDGLNSFEVFGIKNSQRKILNFIHPGGNKKSVREIVKEVIENNPEETFKLKAIYPHFLSILKLCDYYASVEFSEYVKNNKAKEKILDSVLKNTEKYVVSLPRIDEREILAGNKSYEFQQEIKKRHPKFCLLFAPCGRGKTEAALLWAFEVCREFNRNKIIFAMPTQTTSNAMRDRFIDLLNKVGSKGEKYVGLFHGKSFVKLKGEKLREIEDEGYEFAEEDLEEITSENFKGNIFFKPITITTIDHLMLSFVHGFPQADFASGNLQNSVIVFDEVHYYEKQTLKHLVDLFKILRKMQIPHLLMSGTLPDFLIKRVNDDAKDDGFGYVLIKDKKGLEYKPFRIEMCNDYIVTKDSINNNVMEDIVKNFENKTNQFIVLNTVERSQKVFDILKKRISDDRIFLLHSRFTYADRDGREKKIINLLKNKKIKPIIIISTQLIEISLDISCDVMYTELAPADAIAQRGGRLNRGNENWKENEREFIMKVFLPEEFFKEKGLRETPYYFEILQKTKEKIKSGVYSYFDLKKICDRVYDIGYLEDFENGGEFKGTYTLIQWGGYKGVFERTYLFGLRPRDITFDEETGNGLIIRTEKQQKIEVIPQIHFREDERNLKVENQAKIPLWWLKQDEKEHGELLYFYRITKQIGRKQKSYWICKIPYSSETGFDYKNRDKAKPITENVI